jgi:hypothetical protein
MKMFTKHTFSKEYSIKYISSKKLNDYSFLCKMQKQMGPWFACLATTWPCLDGQKDPKSFA